MAMRHDIEKINRINFRSALKALASPGMSYRIEPLFDSTLLGMAAMLLYAEVSYYYQGRHDMQMIAAMTGAQAGSQATADYLFSDVEAVALMSAAKTGSPESPEKSATLVLDCSKMIVSTPVRLTGPGIPGAREVALPLSEQILAVRKEKNGVFPNGVDCFVLTAGNGLIGLPRTTKIGVRS